SKTLIGTHARVEPWDPCVCRIVIPESRVAAFIRSECSSLPLSRFLAGVGVLVYHAAACFPFPGAESRPREGTPQGVRMPAQLDLVTTLTAPPEGTAPQTIALFSLRYADLDPTPPAPLANPLTDVERADLRWYLEEYWKWPYEGFRERAEAIEQS